MVFARSYLNSLFIFHVETYVGHYFISKRGREKRPKRIKCVQQSVASYYAESGLVPFHVEALQIRGLCGRFLLLVLACTDNQSFFPYFERI